MSRVRLAYGVAAELERQDEDLIRGEGLAAAELRRETLRAALLELRHRSPDQAKSPYSPPGRPLYELVVDARLTLLFEYEPGGLRVVHAFNPNRGSH